MQRVHHHPLTRRAVLQAGVLTALGLGVLDWRRLRARCPFAPGGRPRRAARAAILIWLDGGPSHLDTFDPKPDAPSEVRGPFAAVPTSVPGLGFAEDLARLARAAGKLVVVRSLTSTLGEHDFGSHYLLTGYRPSAALVYPSLGSVTARFLGGERLLPPYIAVGDEPNGMAGAGYLPQRFGPFVAAGDPSRPGFKVRDLDLYPGLTEARLALRRELLGELDALSRLVEAPSARAWPAELEQAYRLVTSKEAKAAFDLEAETPEARARYGGRTLGASCLLARRLVERGVPFVTVTDRGWDTHTDLYTRLREGYTGGAVGKVPVLDQALSALIEDLEERGLLDETLVIAMGEFGRTPRITTAGGRDHWPRVFSAVLAGGGVPGGGVVGASDAVGESPKERAVTPADLARTIYALLGVDPDAELVTADGRPVKVNAGGEVVAELLG
jgi:hypothetical protein